MHHGLVFKLNKSKLEIEFNGLFLYLCFMLGVYRSGTTKDIIIMPWLYPRENYSLYFYLSLSIQNTGEPKIQKEASINNVNKLDFEQMPAKGC